VAQVKIIDSYSLECLINDLHSELEQADSQIIVYEKELIGEKQHRQSLEVVDRITKSKNDWIQRRDFIHQCLCRIQSHTKEIVI